MRGPEPKFGEFRPLSIAVTCPEGEEEPRRPADVKI